MILKAHELRPGMTFVGMPRWVDFIIAIHNHGDYTDVCRLEIWTVDGSYKIITTSLMRETPLYLEWVKL